MTAVEMLARTRAAQHVEECLDVLSVLTDKMQDATFRRQQAERIADAAIAIYLSAKSDAQPCRILTGLHRKDRIVGGIGL